MGKQRTLTVAGALDLAHDRRGNLNGKPRGGRLLSLAGLGRLGLGDLGISVLAADRYEAAQDRQQWEDRSAFHDDTPLLVL